MRKTGCMRAARCVFFAPKWKGKGESHGKFQSIPWHGAHRQADAEVCDPVHYFAAGRRIVQHRGPDLYCQRQLSWLLRQCRQHRCVSPDGGGAGDRGDDRRRLLRLRQHQPWAERGLQSKAERRQRGGHVFGHQHCAGGALSDFCGYHSCHVRRNGQRRDLSPLAGIFLLHYTGRALLYVRSGHEPHHPCGRQPPVCHGVHPCGRGTEHHSGPHLHFRFPLGHDGCSSGYRHRSAGHGSAGGVVSAAHEDHPPCKG